MSQPANARRIRPSMPDYGITSEETESMLTWEWIDRQMLQSRNYWVCTTRPDGRPHAAPVWGVWIDNALYFSTSTTSVKGRNLAYQNQVVIHLESGDDTLIIEGHIIEADKSPEYRAPLYKAYAAKYRHDPANDEESEVARWYQLVPHKIMAWVESDFLNSVAYWLFDH